MSSVANWSYTAKATLWPLSDRDDWDGGQSFGAPVVINCDYASSSERLTDGKGVEFVSRMRVFTEHASAKQGDYIAIGDHSSSIDPLTVVGAAEVRLVLRYADTLDRMADDYEVVS